MALLDDLRRLAAAPLRPTRVLMSESMFKEMSADLLRVDPPYVRWGDASGLVHAAGQTSRRTISFCDLELPLRMLEGNTLGPVNCVMCLAQASERGILP